MTSHPPAQTVETSGLFDRPQWWHKPLIWVGFLGLLYILREFFLIGFLTFLFCFVVRGAVKQGGMVHEMVSRFMGLIVIAMGVQFGLTGLRAFMG